MSNESSHSNSEESQVDILIAEYLRRIDAGETVTPDQFVAENAQYADKLKQYFLDVSLVNKIPKGSQPELEETMASLGDVIDEDDKTIAKTLTKGAADSDTSLTKQHLTEESDTKMLVEVPEIFGRYKIKKVLGQGAMGAVYLARDTQLDRDVALKVPKFGDMSNVDEQEMLARFYREARAAATLRSPNICPVFDVGEINGQHYITMAYIKGRPLKDFTKSKKRHSEKQVATTIRKLALGLAEAHDIGVIHRDLKPANIMVDKKAEPVVMDFGLARSSSDEVQVTQSGAIVGTPAYMSPEQVAGEPELIGPQVDIYALGVIMYELLTGVMPFKGNLMAILQQIALNNPTKPSKIRTNIDSRLENICLKMMAGDVRQRYQSMTEVADDLQECLRTPHVKAKDGAYQSNSLRPTSIPTAEEESNPVLISIEKPKSYADQLRAKKKKSSSPTIVEGSQVGIATPRNLMIAGGLVGVLLLLVIVPLVRSGGDELQIPSSSPGVDSTKSMAKELDLSKGLVGHWGFEDGSGTRVLDSSGKLNHGRLEGDVTWGFDSAPSPYAGKRSLHFETGSMTVSASGSLSISKEMSFAFWIKMGDDYGARSFIQMGTLEINSGLQRVNLDYYLEGVEQRVFQDSGKFKPEGLYGGGWNHVVVNITGGNGEIWYNGRLFATNPIAGKISDSIVDLVIGKEIQGSLDDIRIYNRSLKKSEILALANVEGNSDKFLSEPSKVFNSFEFGGSQSASKLHSHINFKHGLAIKKTDDYVSTAGIEMDLTEPFCLEVWFAPRNIYGCKAYRRSLALFGPCQLFISNQGQFNFGVGVYEDILATVGLETGVYAAYEELKAGLTHIAVQWTGEELQFFVNGKLDTQQFQIHGHSEAPADFLKRLLSENGSHDLQLGAPLSKGSDGHLASNLYNVRISKGLRYTKNFKPEVFTNDPQTELLYDFSEGQGKVIKDLSGNGHYGKIIGAKWVKQNRIEKSLKSAPDSSKPLTEEWREILPLVDLQQDGRHAGGDLGLNSFSLSDGVYHAKSSDGLIHGLILPQTLEDTYRVRLDQGFKSNGKSYLVLPVKEKFLVIGGEQKGKFLKLEILNANGSYSKLPKSLEIDVSQGYGFPFDVTIITREDQVSVNLADGEFGLLVWKGAIEKIGESPDIHGWEFDHPGKAAILTYDVDLLVKSLNMQLPRGFNQNLSTPTEISWQNLLPLVDPALDVEGDGGKFEAEELVIGHRSTLTLPVIPEGDYELRAEFTTWNGPKYLHVNLPIEERNPSVVIASHDNETGYLGAGLQLIDGISVADAKNSTRQTETFLRPDKKQTFLCRVNSEDGQSTILATVDGKTIIDWSGSANRLNKPEPGNTPQLKIWSYKGMLKLHSLELRMLNGKLQHMRPETL